MRVTLLSAKQHGFSLLELIVTVVVIVILLSLSLLSMDRGTDLREQKVATFIAFYQAVADEALLSGKLVRIIPQKHGDETQLVPQFKPARGQRWTEIKDDFDAFVVTTPVSIQLSATPVVFPSGHGNDFTATFSLSEHEQVTLHIDGMGRVTRKE